MLARSIHVLRWHVEDPFPLEELETLQKRLGGLVSVRSIDRNVGPFRVALVANYPLPQGDDACRLFDEVFLEKLASQQCFCWLEIADVCDRAELEKLSSATTVNEFLDLISPSLTGKPRNRT